jgi:hypothetical protein
MLILYPGVILGFTKNVGNGGFNMGYNKTEFDYVPSELNKKIRMINVDNPTSFKNEFYGVK